MELDGKMDVPVPDRPAYGATAASRLVGRKAHRAAALIVALVLALAAGCATETSDRADAPNRQAGPSQDAGFESAQVVRVIDGVSIEVEVAGQVVEIKYLGVDLLPAERGEGPNDRALQFNRFLVDGETVELERGAVETDPLGRRLRYVYADGEMVNMALLVNGHATVASFPAEFAHQESFQIAEQSARRDRRGFWARAPSSSESNGEESANTVGFTGGTLPSREGSLLCDYSGTAKPVIKGNMDSRTGERIFHVPGGFFYSTTVVDASGGDLWLCTEEQALAAGWKLAEH